VDLLRLLSSDPTRWASAVSVLDDSLKCQLGTWLVSEWIEGRLEPRLLSEPMDGKLRTALRRELAATVTALGVDEVHVEWGGVQVDDATAARWCWIMPWILCEQDEDLFLMADHLVTPLLDEVRADCPKRSYAVGIVAHHVRDQAHAALGRGPDDARSKLRELARFIAPARAAGAEELAAYLERLERYAHPQKVTEADAGARVMDLWRCHAPPHVALERRGDEWRACLDAHAGTERWIVVNAKTGALHIESPARNRAKAKGRHKAP